MINFSGFSVKDSKNQNGDIEVKIIGLRPGEKLYEELLIDDKSEKTLHEKIQLVKDKGLTWGIISKYLDRLEDAIRDENLNECKTIFSETVSGYDDIK